MEPVSLTIGTAIGLVGLYTVCLEAMEQVEAGKNFEQDSSQLLSMLDAERFLFKKWGEKVGINNQSNNHRCLDDTTEEFLVVRGILKSLNIIWSDSETLSIKYGFETHNTTPLGGTGTPAVHTNKKISFRRKFVWASKDKKRFEQLLGDVGGFIQRLYDVVSLDNDCIIAGIGNKLTELRVYLEAGAQQRRDDKIEELAFRSDMRTFVNEQRRKELLDWVGVISTEAKYDDAKRARHPNTCTWIRYNDDFLGWFGPPYDTGRLLWIHGGPGMGKTFLSASIIEYLRMQSSRPTAYFFCANESIETNQAISILRSWIVQLAARREKALEVISRYRAVDSQRAVSSVLWKIFGDILQEVGGCHLVIDGFDECLDSDPTSKAHQEDTRTQFLEDLQRSIKSTGAKVLLISRNLDIIRTGLGTGDPTLNLQTISEYAIRTEDTTDDIKSLSRAIAESKIKDPTQQDKIANHLSSRCQGMFLWVQLEGKQLRRGMDANLLETILESTPQGLDQAYNRNLTEISKMPKHDRERATDILRWILFAYRPLSVRELLHAILANDDSTLQSSTLSDINDDVIQASILTPCGSLIEVRKNEDTLCAGDRTIHFIHFSAKEFLLSAQEKSKYPHLSDVFFTEHGENHGILASTCISYPFLGTVKTSDSILTTFLSYCYKYWADHFHLSTGDTRSKCINLQRKLLVPGPAFDHWVDKSYKEKLDFWEWNSMFLQGEILTPLHVACRFDLIDLCCEALRLLGGNKVPQSVLLIVAYYGYYEIMQILLSVKGVDVNAIGGQDKSTPLSFASTMGHEAIVRLLLQRKGIDVNKRVPWLTMQSGGELLARLPPGRSSLYVDGFSLLHVVTVTRDEPIAKLLLARSDIDVNQRHYSGYTPLQMAAKTGFEGGVRLLLARHDIKVNIVQRRRTALDTLKEFCHEEPAKTQIAKLIRQRGGKTAAEIATIEEELAVRLRYWVYHTSLFFLFLASLYFVSLANLFT